MNIQINLLQYHDKKKKRFDEKTSKRVENKESIESNYRMII